jgi:hypothetical protein
MVIKPYQAVSRYFKPFQAIFRKKDCLFFLRMAPAGLLCALETWWFKSHSGPVSRQPIVTFANLL